MTIGCWAKIKFYETKTMADDFIWYNKHNFPASLSLHKLTQRKKVEV